jgi:hypothetical protein
MGGTVLAKKRNVEVRINRHTLSVAGQIYQLRNLARVQCWKLVPARAKITYRVLRPAFVVLVAVAAINIVLGAGEGQLPSAMSGLDLIAVLAVAVVTFIRYAKDAFHKPEYVLLLETTGHPIGVLSSSREDIIQNLVNKIAEAIESPPQTPIVIPLNNVVLGDQINQSGDNPVGKVLFGA